MVKEDKEADLDALAKEAVAASGKTAKAEKSEKKADKADKKKSAPKKSRKSGKWISDSIIKDLVHAKKPAKGAKYKVSKSFIAAIQKDAADSRDKTINVLKILANHGKRLSIKVIDLGLLKFAHKDAAKLMWSLKDISDMKGKKRSKRKFLLPAATTRRAFGKNPVGVPKSRKGKGEAKLRVGKAAVGLFCQTYVGLIDAYINEAIKQAGNRITLRGEDCKNLVFPSGVVE